MPRGGPRPNSGAPRGNLNAYKHGRTSRQQARLLALIADDPDARELALAIARRQRQRRRQAERAANAILAAIHNALEERAAWLAVAEYENNQRIPPPPGSHPPPY